MKKITIKIKRAIALIGDTHCGSRFALWSPTVETPQGNMYVMNEAQEQLYEYWHDFIAAVNEIGCDTVIHLGDLLHGTNRKEMGRLLMTPEMPIQMDAAEDLLKPLVKGRQFLVVSGSGYHQSLDYDIHEEIAERLHGTYLGAVANIELTGTHRVMNIAHGESSAAIYRTTIMDREGMFQLAAQALGKLPKIDIVVRGHWHYFNHLHLSQQHLIQVPCWMAFEPSKIYMKLYGKMQPDIGGVILLIDNEDRITVWNYKYPLPHLDDAIKRL